MVLMVVILFPAVVVYDLLTSPKKISLRERIVYFAIMLISFIVLVLYTLDVSVPSPSDGILYVLKAVLHL